MNNILIKSDNLLGLQWLLDQGYEGKIDLVYIDPPFATGDIFSIDASGRTATISKAADAVLAYKDHLKGATYIDFLRQRILLLHKLLSDKGSIYLHIDYKIGHYVKVLMDEIFGMRNFRNDITRIKCNPKNFSRIGYGNIKDMVLFYTKGNHPIWNEPKLPYSDQDLLKAYNKIDHAGRYYTTVPIHAPGETKDGETCKPFRGIYPPAGRHWRCSVDELERLDKAGLIEWSKNGNPRKINYAAIMKGKKVQDIWDFKDPTYPSYPTQKNLDMLNMIVKASSNTDSIVLDCFCGSGTTLQAATLLNRKWIGIDESDIAIKISKQNLNQYSLCCTYDYIEL
ncbi:site-specific DNA-methyltransferase [Candidatus Avelusimicrobium facis]|uniref:site-specific DNA-methyltransferase n=1 Tax=Candidatus Avelusimicrobium facis TaxID=3416203 RepID=UPI003D0A681F